MQLCSIPSGSGGWRSRRRQNQKGPSRSSQSSCFPMIWICRRERLNPSMLLSRKSDGAHFLWATIHFVLNVKPTQRRDGTLRAQKAAHSVARAGLREDGKEQISRRLPHRLALGDARCPPRVWREPQRRQRTFQSHVDRPLRPSSRMPSSRDRFSDYHRQTSRSRAFRSPLFILACVSFPLKGNGADRLSALQANSLGPRSNQPAKWAHPL